MLHSVDVSVCPCSCRYEQIQAIECVYDEREWLPLSKLCLCTHVKLAHPHYYCLNYVEEAHTCTCNLFFMLGNEARCYGGNYLNCTKLNIHVIAEAATNTLVSSPD